MIQMPASPGANPAQSFYPAGTDFTHRSKWGECIQIPEISYDFTNVNFPADPLNAGYAAYLANFDPRANNGRANPRNPNSPNYNKFNPTMGRKDFL